jgi:hypothetical protein
MRGPTETRYLRHQVQPKNLPEVTKRDLHGLGMSVGIGLAALVLVPTTLFGYGLAQSLAPVAIAVIIMVIGALVAGRPLAKPPFFLTFSLMIASGIAGNSLVGVFDGLTTANLLAMIVFWFFAGNLTADERSIAAKIFVSATVVIAVVVCAETLVANRALVAPVTSRFPNPLIGSVRGQGTFGQPLVASFVFTVALILLVQLNTSNMRKVVGVALLTLASVCTGSSSGLVIIALYLGYKALTTGQIWWKAIALVLSLVVAVLVLTSELFATVIGDLSINTNQHRLNSVLALPNLFGARPLTEVIVGSGWNSVQRLYETDIFRNDRFYAIDNQFVSIFAFAGIIGAVCLVVIMLSAILRRTYPQYLAAFLSIVATSLSFDFIVWPVACALFILTGTALLSPKTPFPESR